MLTTMATENNNKNLNVPNLRFPEFSGEWMRYRNDLLFSTVSEKNKNKSVTAVLSASQTDGMVLRDSLGIDIKFEEDSIKTYKVVRNGDYVIHLRSFQGGFAFSERIGVCSPAYTILRPNAALSYGFLRPYFMSDKFINSLKLVTYGIRDGKSISVEEWLKLYTYVPEHMEQQKITSFLTLLDERIATQNKIIEKLESLIKGLCQKLFRFDECTNYFLGDICSITTGKLDANAMVENGKYPFFTCAEEVFNIDNYAFDTEALLISGNGANLGYIHYYNGKFNAYQRTYVLDKFTIDINYIRLYLETFLKNRIEQEKNIGNTPYIVLGTLSKMKIKVPNILTQQKIVKTLTSFKNKLSNERLALKKYEEQKKYLLSNLFI